ncbi:hypothetical protein T4D_6325 [Trichinella pseudospiralis]|uniref:Uncharacterized protein n=1 Tax=Trichinella pseudospiralis TaxID=6337 RepID=A0A0V1CW75_TRIPS|nr:hypothetical protein T4D_6325 [Trichinella pseudospiralis]
MSCKSYGGREYRVSNNLHSQNKAALWCGSYVFGGSE